jgi:hypothetical protein
MAKAKPPSWLNEPMARYIILFIFSLAAAVGFYFLGGSVASVSGNSGTFLGIGFKATGAIAGFVIIYVISYRSLLRLADRPPDFKPLKLRLRVRGHRPAFSWDGRPYQALCTILRESGEESVVEPDQGWEPPYIILNLDEIRPDDRIGITIKNAQGLTWQVSSFYVWDQLREAISSPVKITTWAESEVGPKGGEISIKRIPVSAQLEPAAIEADRTSEFMPQPSSRVISNNVSLGSVSMEAMTSRQRPVLRSQQRKRVTKDD